MKTKQCERLKQCKRCKYCKQFISRCHLHHWSYLCSLFSFFFSKIFLPILQKFILCSSSPSGQLPHLQKRTSTPISLNHHALRGGERGKVGWLMCVSWTSEINAGWFHQFAPGALVLELVVQIRTTVGAIPGQQLRFTEQTRTRPEDQTNTVLLSCRWCCQEQVSQIIFYVLGGSRSRILFADMVTKSPQSWIHRKVVVKTLPCWPFLSKRPRRNVNYFSVGRNIC